MRVGNHAPQSAANPSSLWVYAESPVTSSKLNRWAGNIEAGFWVVQQMLRHLADPEGGSWLIAATGAANPLRVRALASPALRVRVDPGFALGPGGLLGLSTEALLPETGAFTPPTVHPRIDLIGLDAQGDWVMVSGEEAATPLAPDWPEGVLPLGRIHWRVGATSIQDTDDGVNAFLVDARPLLLSARAHRHSVLSTPPEAANGSRTLFSTASVYLPGSLRVTVNGLLQLPGVHYTETVGADGFQFLSAPPTGSVIAMEYQPR